MTFYTYISSPLGRLLLVANDSKLTGLYMAGQQYEKYPQDNWVLADTEVLGKAKTELMAYFNGDLRAFTVPIELEGSILQCRAWELLRTIPYGVTTTYGSLAELLDMPGSARLIGHLIGLNPISVIVPCHRVIGSTGALTGYNGGLARKKWLLDLESPQQTLDI